ncbi:NERD domain-containing protein [Leptospira levettii]|uniref:nuclease-related domain-containing DEAD/DEAH box helicase n=1 Tax=Leptospira levettii TaxID=2023178 RepID=UPI00223DF0B4|nr:NERD domain-containing protein [Leptospira levettii]MCW7498312.1 NERD domain-containing protein [Leptospira levettii]
MPVQFFPNNPIDTLESIIVKEDGSPLHGEIEIYRKLWTDLGKSSLNWEVWHDLRLPEHSDNFNYYKKTRAQIDFLILCNQGILVLEVKGGYISIKQNTFYYGRNFENPFKQNPFKQVEGYKHTLKDKILNNLKGIFFCEAVAFPHVNYAFEAKLLDNRILWTEYNASNYGNSIEKFILKVFEYSKNKHKKHFRVYEELTASEYSSIIKILNPIIGDKNQINSINTLEWLGIQNIEILEGLYKNQRIMIEGPPGSGKTTLAKAYIDKQSNKNGIYLCWNNLLMHHTKSILFERNNSNKIEVTTFFKFIKKINPSIDYEEMITSTEDGFYEIVKVSIEKIEADGKLFPYDYIVIDEAQDLFDRGIDLFINKYSGFNNQGLTNGNSLILYDIDQGYSNSERYVSEIADLMVEYYCHFKINEIKRSAQNPDIRNLSIEILENPATLLNSGFNEKYPSIRIVSHKTLKDLKNYIVKRILYPIREVNNSLVGQDCIVLIESTFLIDSFKEQENLRELLLIKDVEELTEKNIYDKSNKLRYTSILKFKGLERKNIFLIISNPSDYNKYELYVGITRAILNLEIIIIYNEFN